MSEGRIGLNERARQRIREEAAKRKLSHRNMAGFLNWGFNKVTQKMTGRTPMTLNEFAALCFAVGIQPSEAVRDRGLEFCAEMTPTELRFLEHLRKLPKPAYEGLLHFLQVTPSSSSSIETRGATRKRTSLGVPRSR